MSHTLRYQPNRHAPEAWCAVTVMADRFGHTVIVVTELDDNPGMSATNGIEAVTAAVDASGLTPGPWAAGSYTLIEHYPARAEDHEPTFDLVALAAARTGRTDIYTYSQPAWMHLGCDGFLALVDGTANPFTLLPGKAHR